MEELTVGYMFFVLTIVKSSQISHVMRWCGCIFVLHCESCGPCCGMPSIHHGNCRDKTGTQLGCPNRSFTLEDLAESQQKVQLQGAIGILHSSVDLQSLYAHYCYNSKAIMLLGDFNTTKSNACRTQNRFCGSCNCIISHSLLTIASQKNI